MSTTWSVLVTFQSNCVGPAATQEEENDFLRT